MLFNPKWNRVDDPGIHTMKGLVAWLETQDPTETYCYPRPYDCVLAQYYTAKGLKNVKVTPNELSYGRNKIMELPDHFNDVAIFGFTFGGALKAARSYVCA